MNLYQCVQSGYSILHRIRIAVLLSLIAGYRNRLSKAIQI